MFSLNVSKKRNGTKNLSVDLMSVNLHRICCHLRTPQILKEQFEVPEVGVAFFTYVYFFDSV